MFRFVQLSQILLLCGVLPAAVSFGSDKADGKSDRSESFVPGSESYRASFDLGVPRRFATRYLRESRALEIKVIPAKASEFDASSFYDTRFIHRVLVRENRGEVTLSIQLKNAPVAWYVGHQSNPWRIVLDIWRTEPSLARSIEEEWDWQEDASGQSRTLNESALVSVSKVPTQSGAKSREIDLPDNSDYSKSDSQVVEQPLVEESGQPSQSPFQRIEPVVAVNMKQALDTERSLNRQPAGH
ncbi:MAG: hypothetical protein RJB13_1196, partial [Pseudomonadota bacterium]